MGNKHQQPPQVGTDRLEVAYNVGMGSIDDGVEELPEDFEGFGSVPAPVNTNTQPTPERPPFFVR